MVSSISDARTFCEMAPPESNRVSCDIGLFPRETQFYGQEESAECAPIGKHSCVESNKSAAHSTNWGVIWLPPGNLWWSETAWWAMTDSNRRHPPCKGGALPTELIALSARLSLSTTAAQARFNQCWRRNHPFKHKNGRRGACHSKPAAIFSGGSGLKYLRPTLSIPSTHGKRPFCSP